MTEDQNGGVTPTARETIATQIEAEIEGCRERQAALTTELAQVTAEIKAFEQASKRLRGEPLISSPKRGPYKKAASDHTKIGGDLLDRIRVAVLIYARDHEEFRQVDIRSMPNTPTGKSSATAVAFEKLRQEGLIRLARQEGINKYFRLTTEGMRQRDQAAADTINQTYADRAAS